MEKQSFWGEFFTRLKTETPDFFKTLRKYTIALAASAGVWLFAPKVFPDYHMKESLKEILTNVCVAGFVLSGGVSLPKKDTNDAA